MYVGDTSFGLTAMVNYFIAELPVHTQTLWVSSYVLKLKKLNMYAI
jgi:hypothetical protein